MEKRPSTLTGNVATVPEEENDVVEKVAPEEKEEIVTAKKEKAKCSFVMEGKKKVETVVSSVKVKTVHSVKEEKFKKVVLAA